VKHDWWLVRIPEEQLSKDVENYGNNNEGGDRCSNDSSGRDVGEAAS